MGRMGAHIMSSNMAQTLVTHPTARLMEDGRRARDIHQAEPGQNYLLITRLFPFFLLCLARKGEKGGEEGRERERGQKRKRDQMDQRQRP